MKQKKRRYACGSSPALRFSNLCFGMSVKVEGCHSFGHGLGRHVPKCYALLMYLFSLQE